MRLSIGGKDKIKHTLNVRTPVHAAAATDAGTSTADVRPLHPAPTAPVRAPVRAPCSYPKLLRWCSKHLA